MNIRITDNSDKILEELDGAVLKALTNVGLMAQNYAKQNLTNNKSVDTGRLRNSMAYAISGNGATPTSYTGDNGEEGGEYQGTAPMGDSGGMTVYIGTNVEYAINVECGIGQTAKPYLELAAGYREV